MALANETKNMLKKALKSRRIFYVCRDVERAEACLHLGLNKFFILTNKSDFASKLRNKFPRQIILVSGAETMDTLELLKSPEAKKYIKKNDLVMVFKPTPQIEAVCHENNWTLINPPSGLANRVEEKISQTAWLGPLTKYLPKTETKILNEIKWRGKKFILQFNRAHTGTGTILIDSAKKLNELKKKFPLREARQAEYIKGPIITSNNIVIGNKVLIGNISYQITGLKPFTDNQFATIGNDWAMPNQILSAQQKNEYAKMARAIGARLAQDGWRGLFGIDAAVCTKTRRIYLIEINARQPASTTFESILQEQTDEKGATVFAVHLLALLGIKDAKNNLIAINNGAQIIQRVTEQIPDMRDPIAHKPVAWRYIRYQNTKPGTDLLRLQTNRAVMTEHDKLNEHGNELAIFASMAHQGLKFSAPRAGMIILKDNKILLIKRHRLGYNYWVMPGGTLEKNEGVEATAIREIKEETGLNCKIDKTIPPIKFSGTKDEIYFFAKPINGRAILGGPERERNAHGNHYALKWVKISDIKKLNLLPPILKEKIICYLQKRKNS
ncbi:MAG: NUDIX domain-containing protein [Patescibacteria group bacterium]